MAHTDAVVYYLLYKVTIASAFENVYLAAALALGAGLEVSSSSSSSSCG
jgi:hypothetical protein